MRVVAAIMPPPEPVPVDDALTADGPISVTGFAAIHTPGHTRGHMSFLLDRGGGVLFAGDAAAGRRNGIRRSPRMVTDDRAAELASIARLGNLSFESAVFGHGRAISREAAQRFREFAARGY
jgi:glyoxylase-like metal-dependent hydrolase (beta-lactamase superfamily II)